ncbi:DUF4145 domain-containing protein [Vogesella indigofera]|uniref:DUF4145 domain-containing protein n=1 Tax=Vogesella indigofera TaxID=45465 RepID=UPI00234EF9DC|nr:DUF4145 domain-containing protein [Vogesella indigofera]MDC7711659.1 DUF4145 domain-containing protein [Vogesella indigofera]
MQNSEFKQEFWLSDIFAEDGEKAFPAYPCSNCETGILRLEPDGLCHWVDADTKRYLEVLYDEMRVYHFKAKLKCTACDEIHHVLGYGEIDFVFDPDGEEYFDEDVGHQMQTRKVMRLIPNNFFPAPPLLRLRPEHKDEEFAKALRQSFQLFWIDPASCANKIRTAMEYLLDCPPFEIETKDKNGDELDFNNRLQKLNASHADYFGQFNALRWLGNSGTHELSVKRSDVLKAYGVIDSIFHQLFVLPEFIENSKRKAELAKSDSDFLVNKHKPERKQKSSGK